jgi:hypothetical protein
MMGALNDSQRSCSLIVTSRSSTIAVLASRHLRRRAESAFACDMEPEVHWDFAFAKFDVPSPLVLFAFRFGFPSRLHSAEVECESG